MKGDWASLIRTRQCVIACLMNCVKMVKTIDLTDEEVIDTQRTDVDRAITAGVLGLYREKGCTIKVRTQWKAKDDARPDAYRVFCHIGKSKESLILNTRSYDEARLMLQMKIRMSSAFNQLDMLSDNIRNQILHARPCRDCGCPEKAYVFTYQGETYRKCHMLCDNFRFSRFSGADIDSVLLLVKGELGIR